MTVTEKSTRKLISGTGWANPLTHAFLLENQTQVKVYADDVELVLGVDYSVSNLNDEDGYNVTITNPTAWAPIWWVLSVEPPINQPSPLSLGGQFGAAYEEALDTTTRRIQRIWSDTERAWKTPIGIEQEGGTIDAIPEGNFWISDADGNMKDGGSAADIGKSEENAAIATAKAAEAVEAAAEALAAVPARQFASVNDLRNHSGFPAITAANVASWHAGSFVGGGLFIRDDTDTTSADDGGKIIVDTDNRRWKAVSRRVDVAEFGIEPDGTDQTANLVALFGAFASAGVRDSIFYIEPGTAFDELTVKAALPTGTAIRNESFINTGQRPGYKNRWPDYYSKDVVDDDTAHTFGSSYHASLGVYCDGTAGSGSALHYMTSNWWGAGRDPAGDRIIGFFVRHSELAGTDKWRLQYCMMSPFSVATRLHAFVPNISRPLDDYDQNMTTLHVYRVSTAGTSGTEPPTHTSGTVQATGGTAFYEYVQSGTALDTERFGLDEDGVIDQWTFADTVCSFTQHGGPFAVSYQADYAHSAANIVLPSNATLNIGSDLAASTTQAGMSLYKFSGTPQLYLISGTSGSIEIVLGNTNNAAHTPIRFVSGASVDGAISCPGDGTTVYGTSSDWRKKFDVEPLVTFTLNADQFAALPDTLLRVMALRPVSHKWLQFPDRPATHGFIAHEAQTAVPHAVTGYKDQVEDIGTAVIAAHTVVGQTKPAQTVRMQDKDGKLVEMTIPASKEPDIDVPERRIEGITEREAPDNSVWTKTGEQPVFQTIDTGKMVADLTAAVQSLTLMVLDQKARIEELEAR